jgi:hypothetical protein
VWGAECKSRDAISQCLKALWLFLRVKQACLANSDGGKGKPCYCRKWSACIILHTSESSGLAVPARCAVTVRSYLAMSEVIC